MKRWSLAYAVGALVLSMALLSCDAMFKSNLFAGIVKRDLSASAVSDMSTDEVAALTESDTAMETLTEDSAAKQAVLVKLETTYSTSSDPAEVQVAALAAGTVIVETVPVAKDFSGGLVTTVIDIMKDKSSTQNFNVENTIEKLLPAGIVAAVDADAPSPPADFVTLVDTFMTASSAYQALNTSLEGETLDTTTLTSEEVISAGINAVLAYAISNVQVGGDAPAGSATSTPEGVAELLWAQLTAEPDPVSGVTPAIATFDSFNAVPADLENILALVGLDAVFDNSAQ